MSRKRRSTIFKLSCGHTLPLGKKRTLLAFHPDTKPFRCGQCHEEVTVAERVSK